jgi:hypothetical protein
MAFVVLLLPGTLHAQPIENDACANSLAIFPRCMQMGVIQDLSTASNDYDPGLDPDHASCTGRPAAGHDVAMRLDVHAGDHVYLSYSPWGMSDASLYVVADCADVAGTCVAGSDSGGVGGEERIWWICPEAGSFYVICDAYGDGAGGQFSFDCQIYCYDGPPSACCLPPYNECRILSRSECDSVGGEFVQDRTCDPRPCAWLGACCLPSGECRITSTRGCDNLGGQYEGAMIPCDPDPCASTTGACCLLSGTCVVETAGQCQKQNGIYQSDGTPCVPDPCPPTGVTKTSRGGIKVRYRNP